jgi:murein DD-endopeptidase MepM/ murein hydrolase activator NlpD
MQGALTTELVPFGETLQSLSLRYHLSINTIERLNHLTSPNELYVGYSLVILQTDHPPSLGKRSTLGGDQSLLELSILNNTDPWTILADNQLNGSSIVLPGDVLHVPNIEDEGPGALPQAIKSASINSLTQGKTAEIQIDTNADLSISGSLLDHTLNFFPDGENHYTALQGVHIATQPGLYPLVLNVNSAYGIPISFTQMVLVTSGDYPYERIPDVDPATLDPETNQKENELWSSLSSTVESEKLWGGIFSFPADPKFTGCYTSRITNKRSYNGSDYIYVHTGLDICSQIGDPIFASAAGVVVFAGELTVRGNATMIDHGWGVYTAYMHQSEILVNVGDHVEQGQLIGKVGNTGRVEGPHLHFEVLVGGVQVDPLEWLNQVFP